MRQWIALQMWHSTDVAVALKVCVFFLSVARILNTDEACLWCFRTGALNSYYQTYSPIQKDHLQNLPKSLKCNLQYCQYIVQQLGLLSMLIFHMTPLHVKICVCTVQQSVRLFYVLTNMNYQ